MKIEVFFDPVTSTLSYVVYDEETRDAVVIDPVFDYKLETSETSVESVTKIMDFLEKKQLKLHYVLETHAHADHLSAAQFIKRRLGAKVVIGHRISEVQETFKHVFDLPELSTDGSQFDLLVKEGDVLEAGPLKIKILETPGHTPACVSYHVEDALFVGDALFVEDYGTARCDFPKGDARVLYQSVKEKIYTLPDETRIFTCHDYQPNGRPLRYETTVGLSRAKNVQLSDATTEEEFVAFRATRDASLALPRLIYPSLQVNIEAGCLPAPSANGVRHFKIPVNLNKETECDGTEEVTG